MPELPEVETIKQDLQQLIVGKKILDISTDSPKQARLDSTVKSRQVKPSLKMVKKAIVGSVIKKISRRAKLLQIFLNNDQILLIHLKLTGRLLVRDRDDQPDDWQRITISLSDRKELRFCDLRKFGWIKLVQSPKSKVQSELEKLGVEPFSKEFSVDYLSQIFAKTSRAIKIVLMDQTKIAGVGNIYANEALFVARIRPERQAKKLRKNEIAKLRKAIIKVLKAGIKYRGASDQYYLDALGHKGSYQDHFLVYQRDGKRCLKCGVKIKRIKLGGRGTFYCPKCQR